MSNSIYDYTIGGNVPANNLLYVKRQADDDFYTGLKHGEFCYVLNARQMGKSSLRVRIDEKLKAEDVICVNIDITEIGSLEITPAEWYAGIIDIIAKEANIKDFNLNQWWQQHHLLSPVQHLSKFIGEILLVQTTQPIVIFVDESDGIRRFGQDFFVLIRACYNQRADKPAYQRLTFGILGVASPNDLIEDKTITPFNIGRGIELCGFTLAEAMPLAKGLAAKSSRPEALLAIVLEWTGGQPFLTQKLCRCISLSESPLPEGEAAAWVENIVQTRFIEHWESDTQDHPVHLRHIRDRILREGGQTTGRLLGVYQQILQHGAVLADDSREQLELRLSGLVVKRQGRLQEYNPIYAHVFNQAWVVSVLANLRPYAETFNAWVASGKQDESRLLQGQALQKAQVWAKEKNLDKQDYEFLTASEKSEQKLDFLKRLEQVQKERTLSLFDSQLTHASLLAKGGVEDYAAAHKVLQESRPLDKEVDSARRHARNLLAGFVNLMGGTADKVYEGAGVPLFAVAVSPDGRLVVAIGEKGKVVLFDADSGQLVKQLEGHDGTVGENGSVRAVVFHPQGQWLASAGEDKRIILWHLTEKPPSASDWSVEKWLDWQAPDVVTALAVSSDGKLLASGGDDNNISVWEVSTLEKPPEKPLRTLTGHTERISVGGLAFSPDGTQLASASYDDTARVWDVATGKVLQTLRGHTNDVFNVTFSPNGQQLATSGGDKTVRLWNPATGESLRVLAGHQNMVVGLRFTADGNQLISASFDRTLRVWDPDTGVTLRVLQGHTAGVTNIALHGDALFSASNDGTVRRWGGVLKRSPNLTGLADLSGFMKVMDLPTEPASVAIAPDGHSLVVGFADGALRVYALPELRLLGEEWQAHTRNIVVRLVFNREGHWLAVASADNTATVWQIDQQHLAKRYTLTGHTVAVHAVAFSPDSTLLATASFDGQIGVFTLGTEKQRLFKAHDGKVGSVTFDDTGTRLLSSGIEDFTTRLWNLTTDPPTLLQEFPKAQDKLLWATLSPDQQWVASVGRGLVTLYAATTAQVQHRLVGHEQTVFRAIFSPDSSQLATVGGDATVKLWEVKTGKELFTLRLPTNSGYPVPLWDFDFRCVPQGDCWIAVPLTRGKLVVYGLGGMNKVR